MFGDLPSYFNILKGNKTPNKKILEMVYKFRFNNGAKTRVLSESEASVCKDYDFTEALLESPFDGTFEILACVKDGIVYIKPVKKYDISEFESLFGFYGHCCNFDTTKISKFYLSDCSMKTL